MKKGFNKYLSILLHWQVLLGILLISLSALLYWGHYTIFHDIHHLFIYLVGDIAFVPLEVLLVSLIIHKVLNSREKKEKLKKLNMIIGVFFSEVGTDLLKSFSKCDIESKEVSKKLQATHDWTTKEFSKIQELLSNYAYKFDLAKGNLSHLKVFLIKKREFLLSLLANPSLLEHDSFTDLLWAVFHLMEELSQRKNTSNFTKNDADHLCKDTKRVYQLLISEWLSYMMHLKEDYPYLFSLALRTNPFDPEASVEIQ